VESQNSSCNSRIHAYKNGKITEQWKQGKVELLSEEISNTGEISSKRVLQATDYDQLVYKLALKYLQKGYDTIPGVKMHVKRFFLALPNRKIAC
jgi:hypothetical protein